jgi:hypothetical protein
VYANRCLSMGVAEDMYQSRSVGFALGKGEQKLEYRQ